MVKKSKEKPRKTRKGHGYVWRLDLAGAASNGGRKARRNEAIARKLEEALGPIETEED